MSALEPCPDFEAFGRMVLDDWPVNESSDLFDWALACHLIRETPGGYDPEQHIDDYGTCPEKGDPWYEYNFPPERTASPRIAELEAENERLRDALEAVTYTYNPISMDGSHALLMYEIANAALTPKEPTP